MYATANRLESNFRLRKIDFKSKSTLKFAFSMCSVGTRNISFDLIPPIVSVTEGQVRHSTGYDWDFLLSETHLSNT